MSSQLTPDTPCLPLSYKERGLRETKGVSSFRAIVAGQVPDGARITVEVKEGELAVGVEAGEKAEAKEEEAAEA